MLLDLVKDLNFKTRIFCISASEKTDFSNACSSIFEELEMKFSSAGIEKVAIIKQVFFLNCTENESFETYAEQIRSFSFQFFNKNIPLTIVPQPPLNGNLSAEFLILENISQFQPEYHSEYLLLKSSFGDVVISSGLQEYRPVTEIYTQSIVVFEKARQILSNEKLDFSNIIRQWNYIEKIVDHDNTGQHYQVFNDVRSKFYDECKFVNGYPAATGIGMECSGIIIDFIAIRNNNSSEIIPIKSPVQADAHRYSEKVLAEAKVTLEKLKTTPKFERAKALKSSNLGIFFISGTAAIKGESSANLNCKEQTYMTLENIFSLYSTENLNYHKINGKCNLQGLRVYVKDPADFENAIAAVKEKCNNIPVIFVKADICRPELLVEIEGIAEIIPNN